MHSIERGYGLGMCRQCRCKANAVMPLWPVVYVQHPQQGSRMGCLGTELGMGRPQWGGLCRLTSAADTKPLPRVTGRSLRSQTARTEHPTLPHAPRPRTPSSDAETLAVATSLLRRKSAAREDRGWLGGGGKALLQTIQDGIWHGVPLPQLASVTSRSL